MCGRKASLVNLIYSEQQVFYSKDYPRFCEKEEKKFGHFGDPKSLISIKALNIPWLECTWFIQNSFIQIFQNDISTSIFFNRKPSWWFQDIFECRTCGLTDSLCCCTECARTCHKGHDCKLKRTSPTAYCDCWEKCKCKSTVGGHQVCGCFFYFQLQFPRNIAAASIFC